MRSEGYNGSSRSCKNCCDIKKCMRLELNIKSGEKHELCLGTHAKINALIQCALNNSSPEGSVLYCTTFPCSYCTKAIINAKIKKVIYIEDYDDKLSKKLLREA